MRFGHGTHGPAEEAAWLLAHVLGITHDELEKAFAYELTDAERRAASKLIEERRRTRRPLAYLIKEAWLGDRRFYVDERAIVPRSYLAELLREQLAPWVSRPAGVRRALDLCTGSGCLAIMAADMFPNAKVDAADISADALQVARNGVRRNPRSGDARVVLSTVLASQGDTRGALRELRAADRLFTDPINRGFVRNLKTVRLAAASDSIRALATADSLAEEARIREAQQR